MQSGLRPLRQADSQRPLRRASEIPVSGAMARMGAYVGKRRVAAQRLLRHDSTSPADDARRGSLPAPAADARKLPCEVKAQTQTAARGAARSKRPNNSSVFRWAPIARWRAGTRSSSTYNALAKASDRDQGREHGPHDRRQSVPRALHLVAREPREARSLPPDQREAQRSARPRRSRDQEAGRRGQNGDRAVDGPARHRSRRVADGARIRLRPAVARRRGDAAHSRQRHLDRHSVLQPGRTDHGRRLVPQIRRHSRTKAAIRRGSIRSTSATTTTATRSRPIRSNRNTPRRSCSASGFRRPTSIITRWARTARASTCRRTRIRSGRTPIRWCGAR